MSGKYIVMFKSGTPQSEVDRQIEQVIAQGGKINQKYDTLLGFSATIPDTMIKSLFTSEHVDTVEGDGEVSTLAKSLGIN